MSNINDYLLWRGDIELDKKYEFNEVDSMILARFSYLRLDKIEFEEEETIENIAGKMQNIKKEEFLYNGDKELITNLGNSLRFKNMLITDYVKTNERKTEKQFSAVTIHISEEEMYISFIGTDSSIYGWKEDFNMAFMDSVPCQIAGKEYLEKIAIKYPNKRIRIGGHSKGGNVAIYAALTANKEIQNRVIKVYNYDGPGFNKEIINKYKENSILKKVETYLPQDSMIGRIMTHEEECTVALSIEKGIYQHDIYSWQVKGTDLIKAKSLTESSEIFSKALTNWLNTTTNEQRKIFFDGIFEVIYSTEVNKLSDIQKNLSENMQKIYKKYKEIPETERKTITSMIKLFVKDYFANVKLQKTNKLEELKEYYINEGKKKIEEISKMKNKNQA